MYRGAKINYLKKIKIIAKIKNNEFFKKIIIYKIMFKLISKKNKQKINNSFLLFYYFFQI
jgi:hypothetical protein